MFEFDPDKSASNMAKHGIDFDAAQRLWDDERLLQVRARDGAVSEPRWLAVGLIDGRHWSAIFTVRENAIRLISVRRSRAEEVKLYEQEEF